VSSRPAEGPCRERQRDQQRRARAVGDERPHLDRKLAELEPVVPEAERGTEEVDGDDDPNEPEGDILQRLRERGEPPRQRLAVRRVAAERIDDVHTVGSPRPVKAVAVAGR